MLVQPLTHLSESIAVYRKHPIVAWALGLSLVLSVCALCCGLGLVALPWFGCELYAFQIATGIGVKVPRQRAWFSAGAVILVAASLVVVAAAVSALGVELAGEDPITDVRRMAISIGGVALAMLFIVPFTYAPRILIDRGGTIGAAALESARFFVRDGVIAHLGLVVLAHLVQSGPLLIAATLGLALADASAVPFLLLSAIPFLAVTVPIGQGVITAAWVARRHRLTDASRRRPAGRSPLPFTGVVSALWTAPGLSLALVIASLINPSTLTVVHAPARGEVLFDQAVDGPRGIIVPDTALTLEIEGARAAIVASDGGGAGDLPLERPETITHVRITRLRDAFAIDLTTSAGRERATIDRAGVRLDDSLRTRLAERLPTWGLWLLAIALLVTPLVLTRVVVALAELRASSTRSADTLSDELLVAMRMRVLRAGALSALALSPLSVGALIAGAVALF